MASTIPAMQDGVATGANSALMIAAHGGTGSSSSSPEPSEAAGKSPWPAIDWLPVQLSISLPIPRFRVRDLLVLDPGQILATDWPNGDDLPLSVDQVQLAWVEMESVEHEMAVRITRLL